MSESKEKIKQRAQLGSREWEEEWQRKYEDDKAWKAPKRGKTTTSVDPFLEEKARYFEEKEAEARRLWEEEEEEEEERDRAITLLFRAQQEERDRREALEGIARREAVNHPPHYNQGKIEVIDAIEDWGLDFNAGNVIKYVARHQHKAKPLEDLKKARWYLDRIIKGIENGSIED
tara:strand:+ start:166 stop:690 length:525 start_codon:yes stop_codon:yes gene_type:complete